jgi:steroid delta-isomerase-like uncharacterized protein
MSAEENKAISRRFQEGMADAVHTGNFDALSETAHSDAALDTPGMPATIEGMKQALPAFRTAFPDMRLTLGEMIADGDTVAYRATWTATHSGDFMGIPATGKRVTITGTYIDQIVNGKIARHEGDWDQLGLLQQLGALPAMG